MSTTTGQTKSSGRFKAVKYDVKGGGNIKPPIILSNGASDLFSPSVQHDIDHWPEASHHSAFTEPA